MSAVLTPWVAWFLQSVGELTLLLALCCGLDRYARLKWPPRVRNALWLVGLVRLLLPPGLAWKTSAAPVFEAVVPFELTAEAAPGFGLEHVLVSVWVVGALCVFGSWLLRARTASVRLQPANDAAASLIERLCFDHGIARVPRVQIDRTASTPFVTGLVAPRLVLPGAWPNLPQEVLTHAIAHELTHLRRRDLWIEALWMLAAALYWFHPLVHVARRQAYEAREMCCDADTAQRVGVEYRSSMLQLVASAVGVPSHLRRHPQHGLNPAIERLLALRRWPSAPSWRMRVAAVCLALGVAGIVLPGHLRLTAAMRSTELAVPLDASARQQRGLGSLHLRYALQQQMREEASYTDKREGS